ncbi:MAG: hypothetical protein WKG03_03205 [Telluria sp.]
MSKYLLPTLLALAVVTGPAAGQAGQAPTLVEIVAKRDSEWASYRHAYKAASNFAKVMRTRPLIQAHMQIMPLREGLSLAGLRIVLAGETITLDIPVDPIGRATLPMLKQAFDDDAVLRLNRRKGNFRVTGRFSIREKDDGVYSAAELREGCEQLIGAQRDSGSRFRMMGKKCAGVRFIYPPGTDGATLTLRDGAGAPGAISAVDAQPFEGIPHGMYKVVTYRFDAWPAQGEIVASQRPLFIGTLYE